MQSNWLNKLERKVGKFSIPQPDELDFGRNGSGIPVGYFFECSVWNNPFQLPLF